jgi:hypothetical protein
MASLGTVALQAMRGGGRIEVAVSRRVAERAGLTGDPGWGEALAEQEQEWRRYEAAEAERERVRRRNEVSFTDAGVDEEGATPKPDALTREEARRKRERARSLKYATARNAAFALAVVREPGRAWESPGRFVLEGGRMPCEPARDYGV